MTTGRQQLGYRPGLDGVRALAVAGVVLYHAQVSAVPGGFLGVDVFFVLSGFLITSLLLRERAVTGGVRLLGFWAARARRLLPAAVLVIATSVLVILVVHPQDLRLLRGDALSSLLYVNNWHQVFAHRSYFDAFGRPSLLRHFWSLAVEEQFYLVWPPLLLLLLRRLNRRRIGLLALLGAAGSAALMAALFDPAHDPSRIYYGTDTRAMPILLGVALACVWPVMAPVRPIGAGARRLLDAVGVAGLAGVVAAMLGWTDYDSFVYRGGLALLAAAAALLVASAAHPASRLGRALGVAPLVWVGRRSYGIYLWHWPVMAMSRPELDVHFSLWLLVPAQVAVTLVLAAASYRFVEMPVRRGTAQQQLRALWATLDPAGRRLLTASTAGALAVLVTAVAAWPVHAPTVPFRHTESAAAASVPQPLPSLTRAPTPRASSTTSAPLPGARPVARTVTAVAPRRPILAVGASVMLAAIDQLHRQLHATVDAKVDRQPSAILDRLAVYRAHHALPPVVVVQIGENGPLSSADLRTLKSVLRGVPRVVIMNLRYPGESWISATNRQLADLVRGWPQATLADWHRASADPKLLWDGTHPDPAGAVVYAETVARAIDR